MQIMYYGRRGKYVAVTVKKLCAQKAQLVACASFDDVLKSIAENGGDPFKIGVIPILQDRPQGYKTLAVINKLHVVSDTNVPLQIKTPEQKVRPATVRAYDIS